MMVAIAISAVLLFISAFAIDLGMQRAGRRDMQAVADMVALDMARLVDGRTRSEIESGSDGNPTASAQLAWSVANNDDNTMGDDPTVTAYWVDVADDATYAQVGGIPVQVASGEAPNGVVVLAGTDVALAFAGVTGLASGDVQQSAVATAEESACFSVGSSAARLNTTNSALLSSILGGFLGGTIDLSAVSYTGIADANIDLLELAAELGVGSVDELLSTSVSAGTLLIAAANLLQSDGVSNADVLTLVAASIGGPTIELGDLLTAESGTGAAETATINAVDLLAGTVFLANGSSAVSVPALAASLPITGTGLTTSLSIIQKPQTRCGRRGTSADNAQVSLSVDGTLTSGYSALGLPVTGTTAISASVASAKGVLTDIICGSETTSDPSGMDVEVTSGLAGLSAEVTLAINGRTSAAGNVNGLIAGITSLLNLLGLDKVASVEIHGTIKLQVSTSDPSTVRTAQLRVPNSPTTWDDPVSVGSGDLGLDTASVTSTNITGPTITVKNFLGLPISLNATQTTALIANLVSSLTSNVLTPLVTAVDSSILQPLQDLLGIDLGGADVLGQRPYCSNPSLVG